MNTLYVYKKATGEGNLLTYLHEKYTPGIERFLLFLLLPIMIYKIISIMSSPDTFVGGLILLVVIFGSGLQFIALSWRSIERDETNRTSYILIGLIISFLCFALVFLGNLIPLEARIIMIALYSSVTGWLAFRLDQTKANTALPFAFLVPTIFCGWALLRLGILPENAKMFFFNIPVLILLVVGLFLCRKHGTMRTYMIVSLASYVFEYIY
jgi:hypothetical protein